MANNKRKIITAAVLFLAAASASTAQAIVFTNPLTNTAPAAGDKTLDQLINSIMNFFFGLAVIVCPALILWGAWNIATAGGDENKVINGKRIITYAAVGFVVIAASGAIKAIVLDIANTH